MSAPRPPKDGSADVWRRLRRVAIRALGQVMGSGRPVEDAIEDAARDLGFALDAPEHRAWLREVTAGTVRWWGRLELALRSVSERSPPTGSLKRILSLAAYQLIAMDRVPAAWVVSETVDLVRADEGGEPPARFTNAVLRRLTEQATRWRELPTPPAGEAEAALAASLPAWLWRRLVAERGPEAAWDYARASLERPRTWLRTRPGEAAALLAAWPAGTAAPAAGGGDACLELLEGADLSRLAGFAEGKFIVQDLSSQRLVDEIAAALPAAGRALDLCAAPGGKAIGLAWLGWRVVAVEKHDARRALLEANVRRLGLGDRIEVRAEPDPSSRGEFDLVWVDAPCSATGTLRKNPEARWNRAEKDLAGWQATQAQLLGEASGWLREGTGSLAYSVCSVLRSEGAERAAAAERAPTRVWDLMPGPQWAGDGFWAAFWNAPVRFAPSVRAPT